MRHIASIIAFSLLIAALAAIFEQSRTIDKPAGGDTLVHLSAYVDGNHSVSIYHLAGFSYGRFIVASASARQPWSDARSARSAAAVVDTGWDLHVNWPEDWLRFAQVSPNAVRTFVGFTFVERSIVDPRFGVANSASIIIAPPWFPVALLVIWPLLRAIKFLRQRSLQKLRLQRGLCISCGYDLSASPTRCPECGAVRSASSGASSINVP